MIRLDLPMLRHLALRLSLVILALSAASAAGTLVANGPVIDVGRGASGAQVVTQASTVLPSANLAASQPARVIVKLRSPVAPTRAVAAASAGVAKPAAGGDVALQELVARHAGVHAAAALSARHTRARLQAASGKVITAVPMRFPQREARAPVGAVRPDLSAIYVLELAARNPAEIASVLKQLRADANVLYAEEDKVARACYVPNDPSYASSGSWGQSYDDLHGLKRIGTTAAWDTTKGEGVVVAVVDTGVDYNHPDIAANIWTNPGEIPGNDIDDDGNGFVDDVRGWDFVGSNHNEPVEDNNPMDWNFHGTHVAGTIAAVGDNNLGVVGVAWKAKVMALKGLDDSGLGYDSGLARAIIYATDNGADVINASWGSDGQSQTVAAAIDYAHAHGVVFVAAAGNSHIEVRDFYPANAPAAITVSALAPDESLASFSNFGSKIDVAAPGVDILSLQEGTSGFSRHDGTSMAAPHVSGVVALILAQHPAYSVEQVRQALRSSATDLGSPGRDDSFGHGRVSAALAPLVTQVLEARIYSPLAGARIAGPTVLRGAAGGTGFDHYIVDYASSGEPASWVTLGNGNVPATDEALGTLDPSALPDGPYVVRLRVFSADGSIFEDQVRIEVRYLEITMPAPVPEPSRITVAKPGEIIQIQGSARGPSFVNFLLEWAPGRNATSGWSTIGMSLASNGVTPVTGGSLAIWATPPGLSGYYTIRLLANNAGFTSAATTTVYLEPALISGAWPKMAPVSDGFVESSAVPVRYPDGTVRIALHGSYEPRQVRVFSADGSVDSFGMESGTWAQLAVANLDGQPGDEMVVSDGQTLKILSSDLTLLRAIPAPAGHYFDFYQITLADLDNDRTPEIIVAVPDLNAVGHAGEIHAFRTDGTLFFTHPAPAYSTCWSSGMDVKIVAVDLDRDGHKELVVGYENPDLLSYTLAAYSADGAIYPGWGPLIISDATIQSLETADLDKDGFCELILTERAVSGPGENRVRVLNHTGVIRSGWPRTLSPVVTWLRTAIGDLFGDGKREVVVASDATIYVLRDDGTDTIAPWVVNVNGTYMSTPLIADIDNNGAPEILVACASVEVDPDVGLFNSCELVCYQRDGTGRRSWPLFGLGGWQPFRATPVVGDFNGDGQSEVVVTVSMIEGGERSGSLTNMAVIWLDLGTPFNPAASYWTSNFHDPENSRMLADVTPAITGQPLSHAVPLGQNTTFEVAAWGTAPLGYRWQRFPAGGSGWIDLTSGGPYSGIFTNVLKTAQVTMGMNGDLYRCVVTGPIGSATSSVATLSVEMSFGSWQQARFNTGEQLDANISGPYADPDHDGLPNLVEYALGLEPQAAEQSGLPSVGMQSTDWVYTYTRPSDRPDLTYEVEISTNLAVWSTNGVVHELVNVGDGAETWTARYPVDYAADCFFRLKISQ